MVQMGVGGCFIVGLRVGRQVEEVVLSRMDGCLNGDFLGRRRVDRLEVEKLVVCAYEASERTIDAVC